MKSELVPAARPIIGNDEHRAVDAFTASGQFARGTEVSSLESEFSDVLVDGVGAVIERFIRTLQSMRVN